MEEAAMKKKEDVFFCSGGREDKSSEGRKKMNVRHLHVGPAEDKVDYAVKGANGVKMPSVPFYSIPLTKQKTRTIPSPKPNTTWDDFIPQK